MIRKDVSDKVILEQRLKESNGMRHANTGEKNVLRVGNKGRGSEEQYFIKYLAFSGSSRKITVAGESDVGG